MKKLLLSALAVCAFTFSNAQETETTETSFGFAQGDIIVEGNVGFGSNSEKEDDYKEVNSSFNFNPKAGYFISDDLAVGVQLMIGSSKYTEEWDGGDFESKNNSFGAGVFARYYFLELGKRFKTNVEFGVGMNSSKYDDGNSATDDTKTTGFNAGLGLGMNYFVKDNIAITFGLSDLVNFSSSKYDDGVDGTPDVKNNSFNGNLNVLNNFFADAQFGLLFKF